MLRPRLLPVALAAAVVLAACSSDDGAPVDDGASGTPAADAAIDRASAVVDVVAAVVVPRQRDAASAAADLDMAVVSLCDEPSRDALEAARNAWAAADVARAAARMVGPGPTMDPTSVADIDGPVEPAAVVDLLEGDGDASVDVLASGSASRRGLGAVEILLFGTGSDLLADPGDLPVRRCDYLLAASREVTRETAEVVTLWIDGDDEHAAYADVLTGRASVGRSTQGALDELVEAQAAEVEALIGTWLGETTFEGPAGNERAHLSAALGALEDVYGEATALGPLLPPAEHESVRGAIAAALDAIQSSVARIADLGEGDRAELRAAVEAVHVVLRTEVGAVLGRTDGSAAPVSLPSG